MAISYVSDASGAMTTVSPSFTLSAAVATGDVLFLWCSGTATTPLVSTTPPTGWVHALTTSDGHASNTASVVDCTSDAHQIACLYHIVTSGENGTSSFGPLTNLYQTAPTGRTNIIALRGVDTTTPILVATSSFSNTNTATPHVLAGFTAGQVTVTGGWVCASVAADGTGSYTNPSGWTARKNETTTQGRYTGTNNTTTTSGVAVASTNITPSVGDEYCSITLLVQPFVSVSASANAVTATVAVDATNPAVWLTFAEGVSTTTSTTVTGLTNGVSYDFRVAAVNANGTGPFSTIDTDTPAGAGTSANAVAATVTVDASNPTETVLSNASVVNAAVAVAASNPVAKGNGTATVVTATVTVAASNPVASGSSTATVVAATVTVAGFNPTLTVFSNASVVNAAVTVAATNPSATGSAPGTANAVNASVAVAATNPTTRLSGAASVVTATVAVAASNPVGTGTGKASVVTALVTTTATNPTTRLTASATVVNAAVTVAAFNATNAQPVLHPASISGRKVLDQNGRVFLLRTFSSWGMPQRLSNADITTALTGIVADGFNAVTIDMTGSIDHGSGWTRYQNIASQSFWAGTPFQSSLGAAWGTVDWIVSEAARLGMCVCMSLFGGTGDGSASGGEGGKHEWQAATNTNMYDAGVAVATRYLSATNIIWHLELDYSDTPGTPNGAKAEFFFDGINDTEGGTSTRPLRWCEPANGTTAYDQGWDTTTNLHPVNTGYSYSASSVVAVEGWYADAVAPVGDCEPPYDGAYHYSATASIEAQNLRERSYAVFIEGGCLINYGHEDWWPFGGAGIYTEGLSWTDVPTHNHTVYQSYCWTLMDLYVASTSWAPSAFLTGGEGTGDTKAASGNSDTAGIVYFPNSRGSITVDTTLLAGTGNVRLRWYDPTTGAYTSIATSEAQNASRAVTHPGNNAAGEGDQVLVVDLVAVSASANAVTATVTVAAANPVASGSSTAGSVTALVTVVAANVAASGSSTASAVNAAVTVAATDPVARGTGTATVVSATVAVVATNPAASGAATATVVNAAVAVAAFNAVGQTSTAGTANAIGAQVAVAAANPTTTVSSSASATVVSASVVVAAANPTTQTAVSASVVSAAVTVAAFNPTARGAGNASVVSAPVAIAASNPTTTTAITATVVAAVVVVAAANAVGRAGGNANAVTAQVVVTASNPTLPGAVITIDDYHLGITLAPSSFGFVTDPSATTFTPDPSSFGVD